MEIEFNTHGNEKQFEAAEYWIDNSISDICYGGSKYSGKTFLGCSLIFGDALTYPGTHHFIARKTLNDLRKFTRPTIEEVLENYGLNRNYVRYNAQDNYYTCHNDSKIYLLEAKLLPSDPEYRRFGSMNMTRGMIEEAGEFEEAAKNNLSASVGRWRNARYGINGKIIQLCNPAKNYLYREYYRKHKQGDLEPHKRFIQALPSDNKKAPPEYLQHLMQTLNLAERERLLFGNWEYDDDPATLIPYDNIISIFENDHLVKDPGEMYLTADVARLGSDKAIIAVWKGWVVLEFQIFDKSRTTEIQNCINTFRAKYIIPKKNCIADEDGVGGGVVDNCEIRGFKNNGAVIAVQLEKGKSPEKPNFDNLQTQCIYGLVDKINKYGVHIAAPMTDTHKQELIEDLEQVKSYKTDTEGKKRVIPKEKVKEKLGRSPDWRDTLLMRYWFELNPYTGKYVLG